MKNDTPSASYLYKRNISKTKLLSSKKQLLLLEKVQQGDLKAKDELIECNLRFILKVAIQYKCKHLRTCDLINEGVLGLIRALETFDAEKGFVFISYAVWWIRLYMQRAINEKDNMIKLPETVISHIKKEMKEKHVDFDLTFDAYRYMKMKQSGISYDTIISKTTGDTLLLNEILPDKNAISPEHSVKDEKIKDKITTGFLEILPDMERYVIERSFGINGRRKTAMNKLSEKLNLKVGIVRNIREQALKRIRLSDTFEDKKDMYNDYIETE